MINCGSSNDAPSQYRKRLPLPETTDNHLRDELINSLAPVKLQFRFRKVIFKQL